MSCGGMLGAFYFGGEFLPRILLCELLHNSVFGVDTVNQPAIIENVSKKETTQKVEHHEQVSGANRRQFSRN